MLQIQCVLMPEKIQMGVFPDFRVEMELTCWLRDLAEGGRITLHSAGRSSVQWGSVLGSAQLILLQ